MKHLILFTTTVLVSSAVLAGGGLFGGGDHSKNPNGVKSIAVELCGVDKCPEFRMIEGACTDENGYEQFGTCFCQAGFVPVNGKCEACPEGEYSDGKNACTKCGAGTHAVSGTTECQPCEGNSFAPISGLSECLPCPAHATCTKESFECLPGFHAKEGTITCVCDNGTTLSGDTCVSCVSLNKEDGTDGECGACKTGYKTEGNGCIVDQCYGIVLNDCQSSCDPISGEISNKSDGTICDYTTSNNGVCYKGSCQKNYSGLTCYIADNSECGGKDSYYYCAFLGLDGYGADPDPSNPLKPKKGKGVCETIKTYNSENITEGVTSTGHIYNKIKMDWWSANAWCVAKGSNGLYEAPKIPLNWREVADVMGDPSMGGYYWIKNLESESSAYVITTQDFPCTRDDYRHFNLRYAFCE